MDIVLERILSLLPKKPDGNFVRGSKKDFATSIGYDSGDIVSMWINGSSTSYYGKLHEIAAKYNVSVEWLKGESDQKEKSSTPNGVELDAETIELREIWNSADRDEREALLAMAKMLKARRNK